MITVIHWHVIVWRIHLVSFIVVVVAVVVDLVVVAGGGVVGVVDRESEKTIHRSAG